MAVEFSPGLTEERAEVCKGDDLMCGAKLDCDLQHDFYKLFSFIALLLLWQALWPLRGAELIQSCVLVCVLP